MTARAEGAVEAAVAALQALSRTGGDWIETGAVADTLGTSVGDAAVRLRAGGRRGLCSSRRSLMHGTVWRATERGQREPFG